MKKSILAIFLFLFVKINYAQTFTNSIGGLIPDNNTVTYYPVTVNGLPDPLNSSFGIASCSFTIVHQFVGELKIWLVAPDSTSILLVNNNGGPGTSFSNTCLRMDSTIDYIVNGSSPFSGNYLPIQTLNVFNSNVINPNGDWQLAIKDEVPTHTGALLNFSISFINNPSADPPSTGICSTTDAGNCKCIDTTMVVCDLLPDMTASAECIINDHTILHDSLFLGNATPNIGTGPLEIRGISTCFCDTVLVPCTTTICPNGQAPTQMVTQRIYTKTGNVMTWYDRPAGTMQYHPSHGHTHVDSWASYTLRVQTSNPNATTWPIVGSGSKQSYCLVNLGTCDNNYGYCVDTLGNVLTSTDFPNYGLGTITGCGTEQGIYVGNLDIYSGGLPGQQINYPGVCNDNYYIVSITDPDDIFLEINEDNNWTAVPVSLSQQNGAAVNKNLTIGYNGLQVSITSQASPTYIYNWNFGDSVTSTGNSVIHTYALPGSYTVSCEIDNGTCKTYTAQVISVPNIVGLNEANLMFSDVKITPNPFKDNLIVSFINPTPAKIRIELTDVMGQIIQTLNSDAAQGKQNIVISPEVSSGVYFLKISDGKSEVIKRVVKF